MTERKPVSTGDTASQVSSLLTETTHSRDTTEIPWPPAESIGDTGTPAEAVNAPPEALAISPPWSEFAVGLLKRVFGPQRESVPNTPLEPSERDNINGWFQEIKEDLAETQKKTQKKLDLTAEQLKVVMTTLDEMREASERIHRKDWLLLAIGALTTLVISAAIPPAAVVHVGTLFIHKVAPLFGEELAG